MKPAIKFLFSLNIILLCIILSSNILLATYDTVFSIGGVICKNNIVYAFGSYSKLLPPPAPDGESQFLYSFVNEYDITTNQLIRTLQIPQVDINHLRVDSKGNKYISGMKPTIDFNYDYLESDKVHQHLDSYGTLIISKYNFDNTVNYYNTIIPVMKLGMYSNTELNQKDELYFVASSSLYVKYTNDAGEVVWPLIPVDTSFYTSPNAYQPLRNLYESPDPHIGRLNHAASDLYIAKLSEDGKRLDYASFLGSRGSDSPLSFAIGKNSEIAIVSWMGPSWKINAESYTGGILYGMYPTTNNSIEPKLTEFDSTTSSSSVSIPPRCLGILDSSLSNLLYGSYYTFGHLTDIKYDNNNRLVVVGWNRENDYGMPVGSFIARFNENMDGFSEIKSLSALDKLDTLVYYHWADGEDGSVYNASLEREVHINIDTNGYIELVAFTNDPHHPVTADALQPIKSDSIDFVIYKLDKDFNVKYCSYFGSNGIESPTWNSADPAFTTNSVYIIGQTTDIDFPPSPLLKAQPISMFIAKVPYGDLAVNENQIKGSFSIFPNPASDYINIEAELIGNEIEIYNQMGLKLTSFKAESMINISDYPSGVYTIRSGKKVQRFVKM
jgi:hypothetical protein